MPKDFLHKYYRLLHPRPAYIIAAAHGGVRSAMAASWVQPLSEDPPRIIIAWEKESYTLHLARKTGCYTVNIVGEDMLDKLYYVGTRSGWDEPDKVEKAGLVLSDEECPTVQGALGWIRARIHRIIEDLAEDVDLVVGDVVDAWARQDLYNPQKGWLVTRARIPLQIAGRAFTIPGRIVYPPRR